MVQEWIFNEYLSSSVVIEISKYTKDKTDFIEVFETKWEKLNLEPLRNSQSDRITHSETNFLEKYIHFEIKLPKYGIDSITNELLEL